MTPMREPGIWKKMVWWMMERYFDAFGKFDCASIDARRGGKSLE